MYTLRFVKKCRISCPAALETPYEPPSVRLHVGGAACCYRHYRRFGSSATSRGPIGARSIPAYQVREPSEANRTRTAELRKHVQDSADGNHECGEPKPCNPGAQQCLA